MNFLVSGNHETVLQFQVPLGERGDLEWLVTFPDLLARAAASGAGLVVIDTATPGYEGNASLRRLKQLNPSLKLLLVGSRLPPQQELAALAAGAMGCCGPDLGEEQVRRILAIVEEGGVWISNAALPNLLQRLRSRAEAAALPADPVPPPPAEGLAELTHREHEIASMVAAGDSNKIIARKLNITDRTVKAHLTTIFQKLHVHDRLQLALYVSKGAQ